MRISARPLWRGLGAALLLSAAGTASAAGHFYVPYTLQNNSGTQDQGMWLADIANLGNPPFQLSNQVLDGPTNINVAILNDWTFNATTHEATLVTPKLVVYGVGGKFYKANLATIGPVQQFSTGNYAELCTLTALDSIPYSAARAYVQAVVEPAGSVNTCASGIGTQTWLIPATADSTVAPTLEPTNWSVLGAFTDPTTGAFVRWIVWTGNAVVAYNAKFTSATTLLVGPPTGPAPAITGRVDGNAFLLSGSDSAGVHTDALYHVSMTGSTRVATYSYADGSACGFGVTTTGVITSSIADTGTGILLYTEPTSSGYAVYNVPLAGGTATQIYADASGNECGTIGGDSVSAGHVGLNEADLPSGLQHVIALNETGPVSQTPVLLASGADVFAFLRYTISGHFWISDLSADGTTQNSVIVADGDGTLDTSYNNSVIGDSAWGGFFASGTTPSVARDIVYVLNQGAGGCSGTSLAAVDPAALTGVNISNLPADTCSGLEYGWLPASVGNLREPAGASPIEVDPVGGKMYFLLGPDTSGGTWVNLAQISGFPFF